MTTFPRDASSVAKRLANELGWIDETMTAKVSKDGTVMFTLRVCGEVTTVASSTLFIRSFIGDPAVALAGDFRRVVGGKTKRMTEGMAATRRSAP